MLNLAFRLQLFSLGKWCPLPRILISKAFSAPGTLRLGNQISLGIAAQASTSLIAYRCCETGQRFMRMGLTRTSSLQWLTGTALRGLVECISPTSREFQSWTCEWRVCTRTFQLAATSAQAIGTPMPPTSAATQTTET